MNSRFFERLAVPSIMATATGLLVSMSAFAAGDSAEFAAKAAKTNGLECANVAVEKATEANFEAHGAASHSCGAKLLTAGAYLETYLVCVSDETDPSEWVMVMEKNVSDSQGKVIGKCAVKHADVQYDSETPNFEDSKGLLETVACSVDEAFDGKVRCK